MSYSSMLASILAIACGIYFAMQNELEASLYFSGSLAAVWSMIVFSHIWAEYGLGFGFMESLAKDSKTSEHSGPALKLLGWTGLPLISYFVFF